MNKQFTIGSRRVGENCPVFIVAEMSANHLQDYNRAIEIIHAAKEAGADAIKLQTYTADTITLDCDSPDFQINEGTVWDGTTLHKLYEEAYTPWDWQPKLMEEANRLGLECFSSPFDATAVDFMASMNMPAYNHKPVILATGVAYLTDIERALAVCREEGNEDVLLAPG